MDESQNSISTPKTGNHKGRMEIPIDPERFVYLIIA